MKATAKLEMMEELARQMREEIAEGYGDEEMDDEEYSEAMDGAKETAMSDGDLPEDLEDVDLEDAEMDDEDADAEEMEHDCDGPALPDKIKEFMAGKKHTTPSEGAMVVVRSMSPKPSMAEKKKPGKGKSKGYRKFK